MPFPSKSFSPATLLKLGQDPTLQSLHLLFYSLLQSHKLPLIPFLFSQFISHGSDLCISSKNPGKTISLAEIWSNDCAFRPPRQGYADFVSSSIISGFTRMGSPELGVGFYEQVEKSDGFRPGLVTCTAVVDALCRVGRMEKARDLVRKMEVERLALDAVLYSAWICGCFRNGDLMEGLRKHREMIENGVMPDVVSFSVVIDGFCKEGSVEKVVGFLVEMKSNGIEPNLITYTMIIRGFCNQGKMEEAFCMLRKLEGLGIVMDEFVYAILIDGLCKAGDLGRVFGMLEEMERKGIEAGSVTYNSVINGLCKVGNMCKANEISKDFSGDNFTYSTLLLGYTKQGDVAGVMEMKRRLDESGVCMDVVTCNVLIKALFMVGMVEDVFQLFREMPQMGLVANDVTYCTLIDGCCKLGKINEALHIFHEYRQSSSVFAAACYNCLISGLCKECMVEMAVEVFLDLVEKKAVPDASIYRMLIRYQFKESSEEGVTNFIQKLEGFESEILSSICNDAISFLCANHCSEAALEIYVLLRRRGLVITSKPYFLLLKNLIQGGNQHLIQLILNDFIKSHGTVGPRAVNILALYLCKENVDRAIQFIGVMDKKNFSMTVLSALVYALKKRGRANDAYRFLMEAEENGLPVDVFVYSSVVDGLCKEGYLEESLDLCESMRKKAMHPNIVTYNSVINGLCHQGCFVEAFRLLDSLEHCNVFPTVFTYATLIRALSKEGFLQDAKDLFEKMVFKGITPNIRIYNLLINGYCSFGLTEEAQKLLMDMEEKCLQPDAFTVSALITGYCLKGDVEGALDLFTAFRKRGLFPDLLGFMNLVKGLFSKGRAEEARSILRDMLQCIEVINLINRVGNELNVESLVSLLAFACEQGRIKEVIDILNEVGDTTYSSWRSNSDYRRKQLKKLQETGARSPDDMKVGPKKHDIHRMGMEFPRYLYNSSKLEHMVADIVDMNNRPLIKEAKGTNIHKNLMGKSPLYDFDLYFFVIASLCSKGELQKANSVVRAMFLNSEN